MSNKLTANALIDELYDALERSTKLPLINKSLTDVSEMISILDELSENLPEEISQARAIVSDRNTIIEEAKKEAENIIKNAQTKAEFLVSQEEVTKNANEQAAALIEETQQKVREMKKAANDYVENIMKKTDDAITAQLTELRKTRQNLRITKKSN